MTAGTDHYQTSLLDRGGPDDRSLDERFADFHSHNPHVYDALVALAREARRINGRAKVGIGMLFEVLRWQTFIRTQGESERDGYKLNNVFRSRYARLIMERERDLAGIFDTRELKS